MTLRVNVLLQEEENWFVAKRIENSVVSQGKTIDETLMNLKEALELHYDGNPPETGVCCGKGVVDTLFLCIANKGSRINENILFRL